MTTVRPAQSPTIMPRDQGEGVASGLVTAPLSLSSSSPPVTNKNQH